MRVALIDYGAGNLRSAAKALETAGRPLAGLEVVLTSDPEVVARADRIVLPGDGAFPDCRRGLAAVNGMDQALDEAVRVKGRPFLGICVGMQLLVDTGHEFEPTAGLGWLPGECVRVTPDDAKLKVPHMGWNTLERAGDHPVLAGLELGPEGWHAYFLHGWHVRARDPAHVLATASYGGPVTAVVGRDTIVGTQFHPEKSQRLGLGLLANFLNWAP